MERNNCEVVTYLEQSCLIKQQTMFAPSILDASELHESIHRASTIRTGDG